MSLEVGELYAKLVLDKTHFEKGLHGSEHSARSWGKRVGGSIRNASRMIVASIAVIGAALIGLGEKSAESAEVQERAEKLVDGVFHKAKRSIIGWSQDTAKALGVHDDMLEVSIAKYGIWAKNVGKASNDAIEDGAELARRAAEISLVTGDAFEDVFSKLLKGEQGATRGLKLYGVAISPVAIKAEAMRLKLYKGTGALSDQAKAAAIHSIIMKNTAKYTGIAASMQDTLAAKSRKMGAVVNMIMDMVGGAFLEAASGVGSVLLPAMENLRKWVKENLPAIQKVIAGVMKAIRDGFTVVRDAVAPFVAVLIDVAGQVIDFLKQGDNLTYFLQALGVILAIVIVPALVALAATFAPVIAFVAGLTLLIKWLTETGIGAQIVTGVVKFLGDAFNFITGTVIPALSAAFDFVTGTVIPDLIAGFGVVSSVVLPYLQAAFDIITGTVIPAVGAAFDWISTNILPPLISIIQTISTVIVPALVAAFQAAVDWVVNNLPIIGHIFEMVAGFVQTAVMFIANVVGVAFGIVAAVIQTVAPVIVAVGSVIFPAVGAAATALLNVISYVFDTIGAIWSLAWRVASDVANGIAAAFGALQTALKAIFDGIVFMVKAAINTIISVVNGMIDGLDAIQVHVPEIGVGPVHSPAFDWSGLGIGHVPYLAKGTPRFKGGWAVLGERGPELARLPGGTRVWSNDDSKGMMGGDGSGGGGAAPLIGEQHIYGVQPGDVERETRRALRRKQLEWRLSTR